MKPGGINHPKVEHLAETLGIRLREARGILEALFHLASQYAERGDIGRFSDTQIAKRLDWGGEGEEPDRLIEALAVGWLDTHPTHRFVLHDWPDHAPDYIKRKMRGTDEQPGPGWAVDDVQPPDSVKDFTRPEYSRKFQNIPENSGPPLPSEPLLSEPIQSQEGEAASAAPPPRHSRPSKPKTSRRTPAPDNLTSDQQHKLVAWVKEKYPEYATRTQLRRLVDACLDYHRSRGNLHADWLATCRSWIRKQAEMDSKSRGPPRSRELPQMQGPRTGGFSTVGEVLGLVVEEGER